MGRLIYTTIGSLDGYMNDADGSFDWAAPDAEVHAFVNDLERPVGTYLYGRRMYETMLYWETATVENDPDIDPVERDYGLVWRAAEKVVFSTTLGAVSTERTRIERRFDADAVRRLVEESPSDVGLGGATLARDALRAGLVDEYNVFTFPVLVGGGTPQFPTGLRADLRLIESRSFASGVTYARYAVA